MKKHITDKQEYEIGRFGREHLQYLKENQPMIYTEFLFSGRLNAYLHEVEIKALDMYERLIREYSLQQGNRAVKSQKSDGMGRENEQYSKCS